MEELLFLIGETLLTEIDEIADIKYDRAKKNTFTIIMADGAKYVLCLNN